MGRLVVREYVDRGPGELQARELAFAADAATRAQFTRGSWSLSARDAADADAEGTVRFVATPWADVTCDGRVLGQTPFREQRLPAGTYDCELKNPDLGISRSVQLEVRANRRSVVRARFE